MKRAALIGIVMVVVVVAAVVLTRPARDVTLVKNQVARAAIYITPGLAQQKDSLLLASVNDLAHYLGKMSGAKVDVITGNPSSGSKLLPILIGDLAIGAFGEPGKTSPYKQGWRLVVSEKGIGMMGQSEEATSYAIYELLDRLGCRWYMPSEMGEVIPRLETVRFPLMDVSDVPATLRRERLHGDEAFKRRNRLGGVPFQVAHALEDYITADQLKAHPDWNGELDGKRSINGRLCWANPEVAQAVANRLIGDLDKGIYTTTISLSPNDGFAFCECKKCKALDAADWDTSMACVSITDRYIHFLNQIAETVTRKYPDVIFGANAYVQFTRPPVREKVHPNIVPVLAPITYCQAHSVENRDCPTRQDFRRIAEGWGRATPGLGFGLYEFAFVLGDTSAPFPQIAKWGEDLRFLYDHGLKFWVPEACPASEAFLPGMWLGIRMSWNPKANPETIVDEFYRGFYGPAAGPMRTYWTGMDDAWIKVPQHTNGPDGYPRRFTPVVLAAARTAMDQALSACAPDSVEYQRVKMADESLREFALYMKMYRDLLAARFEDLEGDNNNWTSNQFGLMEQYEPQAAFCRQRDYSPRISNHITDFHVAFDRIYKDATRIARDFSVVGRVSDPWKYMRCKEGEGESGKWHRADLDDAGWKQGDAAVTTFEDLNLYGYGSSIWFRNSMEVPEMPPGKKAWLWVVGTNDRMKVFVNGKEIAYVKTVEKVPNPFAYRHAQSYDITSALRSSQDNQFTIACHGGGRLIGPVVLYRDL